MRLKIGEKLKMASSTQDLPVLKKKSVLRLAHFWKNLNPKVIVNIISLLTNNLKSDLRH